MVGGPLVPPAWAPQSQPLLQRPQQLLLGLPMPLSGPADAPHKLLQATLSQATVLAHREAQAAQLLLQEIIYDLEGRLLFGQ